MFARLASIGDGRSYGRPMRSMSAVMPARKSLNLAEGGVAEMHADGMEGQRSRHAVGQREKVGEWEWVRRIDRQAGMMRF
jgi:hypothetical protein